MPFPTDEARIEVAEQALGRRLPAGYRASMTRANGGCVQTMDEAWWLYPIFDDSDPRRLKRTCNHVLRETREAQTGHNFPEGALAIASNGSGDYLVLLPKDATDFDDTVYRHDHESGTIMIVAERFDLLQWSSG